MLFLRSRSLAGYVGITVGSFFLVAGSAYALPKGVTQGSSIEGVTEYTLQNGLKVLLAADASQPSTTVNMTYLVGSRHENYGQTGMAHLLEHMMFRGTPKLPNALAEFSKRGLAANGTTSADRTNYYATFAANPDTLNWYLDWQADTMVNATISREDLDAEMTVVRNEMESGENNPFRVLMQKMFASAFQWHNYGKSTIGARSDVENVDIAQLRAFYHEYYQPDNAVLIVTGQFDPDATLTHIAKAFNTIPKPKRSLPPEYTEEPVQDGPRRVTLRRHGGSPLAAALYHIPAASALEYIPLSIGIGVLSDTPSGRLYQNLVDKNLATSVFGFASDSYAPGYALFGAQLQSNMSPQESLNALTATIEDAAQQPFKDDDIQRIRSQWLNGWAKTYADASQLASALSESTASGDWRLFFLQRDQVEQLRTEEVNEAVARWLVADNRTSGIYEPTDTPKRAPAATKPDLSKRLENYQGKGATAEVEAFAPTVDNIQANTQVESLPLKEGLGEVKLALLPKATRGNRVEAILSLQFGSPEQLKGSGSVGEAVADLLEYGTPSRSRQHIADQFTELQSDVSFSGDSNSLTVRISTLKDQLAPTLDLVLEVLREANFPESEVDKYKNQLLTYYQTALTEPSSLAAEALSQHDNPWPKDDIRYQPSLKESIAEAEGLSRADLRAFHERFYGTGDVRFSATGSFDPEAVKQSLTKGLNAWRAAPTYERAANPYRDITATEFDINTPDKANGFYLATQSLPLQDTHPDYVALSLANYLLGQSETSRLWNRVRVKEGLSYDVRSALSASAYEPNGSWTIHAIFAPENAQRVQAVIREELDNTLKDGFSEAEVQEAIQSMLQYRRLARGRDAVVTNTWDHYLDLGRDFTWSAQFDQALAELDAEQVNQALRQYLDPEQFSVAIAADHSKYGQAPTVLDEPAEVPNVPETAPEEASTLP